MQTKSSASFAKSNGIELCYSSFGDPQSPPLLLIMGLAAQMVGWDEEFCTTLAQRGYYVIRFDNRDAGLSTRFDDAGIPNITAAIAAATLGRRVDAPYLLSDMAEDSVGLLDALGIPSAHVVGASMGGAIAQLMAITHPSRVRTLTSIMSTTGAPDLPPPTGEALNALFTPAPADQAAYLEHYARTWRVLRAAPSPLDEARDSMRALQVYSRGLNPPGVARQMVAVIASGSRREALARVETPTLVLHGDADPLLPLACGVDTASSIRHSKLVVLNGMGHALSIAYWPQIIDAIDAHAASAQ